VDDKLVVLAQQKRAEGVPTTTMGLGTDCNEDLLMAMAEAGGGAFYFIESPEVTPTIFQEELQGLLSVVGQNLVIGVDPTDYVTTVNQLNSYPMHTNGRRTVPARRRLETKRKPFCWN
jgi:Ca-activated chloride channel family protein